ncbi:MULTISPECIES: serine/threonine-protein kinase [Sorangium]|uniref:non-specific serine/threonine protein kinase n=1 Tax=Sorangium cellulosum TaxID=56 RepID=A0A4P2QJ73_SORCE|nr:MULTISPECIES: serine/threonine-protein kinase [Sorangium]AUX29728.1 protein kinase [Sorangium cellulosum]WCQ89117.1 serine-threonine kinase [Sorangium sp. Soce836]
MTSLKAGREDRAAAQGWTDAERAPRAAGAPAGGQEVVAGRYAVETRLGVGGVGAVHLAIDRASGQRVALKRVDPRIAENRPAVDRLLRGARAARALSGRYVARTLDVGVEGGVPFVVSEYLEGSDLASYLQRRGPLRAREAVKYLLQICEAVAEAHGVGLLHRDLKPENVFLSFGDGAPSVKVLDFGVSAVACGVESEGPNAASGAMRTSLLYMAPEQMRSAGGIDERADVWSIGAVAYALLCGASPFEARTELEICNKVLNDPPAPFPRRFEPAELGDLVLRCLDKDPEARPSDVAKLAFALARFGGEGAEDAAERVWEALRAEDETLRMATPAPAPVEDEWEADTLADLPMMSPDDLMGDLETTAKWDAPGGVRHGEITLVSHAGASWDGGEQLRPSRTPPPVLTVSPPELPADVQRGGAGQRPAGGTPVPLDRQVAHRVTIDPAPRVTPAEARAPAETERLTVVRRGPSPWPRRLAIALAVLGMAAGVGGVWLVQTGALGGGESAVLASKGVARRAAQEARSAVAAMRPVAAVLAAPGASDEPAAPGPDAESAPGPDGEALRAVRPGGLRYQPQRPDVIYDEVERERRRREKIEREQRWREGTERARQERDAMLHARQPSGEATAARPGEGAAAPQPPQPGTAAP